MSTGLQPSKTTLKLGLLIIGLASGFVLATSGTQPNELGRSSDALVVSKTARQLFVLPKQFDFDYFQIIFNKHYSSALDRLVRARLFLGRSFRAFISKISYKHGKSSSYLGINHMSDWTPEEIKRTVLDAKEFAAHSGDNAVAIGTGFVNDDGSLVEDPTEDDVPVADLPAIEMTLEEAVENRGIEPAFDYIAQELTDMSSDGGKESIETLESIAIGAAENESDERGEVMSSIPAEVSDSIRSKKSDSFLRGLVKRLIHPLDGGSKPNTDPLPDEIFIDYRDCLLEARTQKQCGACYAFSTVALYEWAFCKATGKKVAFSEQYPLDCARDREGINGCVSGYPRAVRDFTQLYGLQLRDEYPYKASVQECKRDPFKPSEWFVKIRDKGWNHLSSKRRKIEKQLRMSPVVMALLVDRADFFEYAGGVDMGSDCHGKNSGGHGMLLVGSGREDGQEYWLLRNSFGADWGERGHYKLNKETTCILDEHGLVLNLSNGPVVELRVEN